MEGIPGMEELFSKKPFPEYLRINESLDSLAQITCGIKHPNLTSKYRLLEKYCDETIYMFSVTNFPYSKSDVEKKFEELSLGSVSGEEILLSRINGASPEWDNVQRNKAVCLYIGKTRYIREVLKEHLFLYREKSQAMHLEKWLDPKLTITIDIWGFRGNLGCLRDIEDYLWKRFTPLFVDKGKIDGVIGMTLTIEAVKEEEKQILKHLWEESICEEPQSAEIIVAAEISGLGPFLASKDSDPIEVKNWFSLFIKVNGKVAGFVAVDNPPSISRSKDCTICEYFIIRECRRLGIEKYVEKYIKEKIIGFGINSVMWKKTLGEDSFSNWFWYK